VLDNVKVEILKIIASQGYTTASDVAKRLGITWGAVQWHLFWLENNGYIKSVKTGETTIYILNCANALRKLEAVEKALQAKTAAEKRRTSSSRQGYGQ